MATSRKSRPNSSDSVEAFVAATLKPLIFPRARLVLGLSGGIDSVVLLEVLHRLAVPLGFHLSCVHVNHRISPNAGSWAQFCVSRCKHLGVPLALHDVSVRRYRSDGLEAAARRARYQVYALLPDADFIVLAQHLDDQAETLLLQLLRGAGVKGGAAMPVLRAQDSARMGVRAPAIVRPMLDVSRQQIAAYAKANRLEWVEDESNADTRYDRNFLRHQVLPVIGQAFPGYRTTLARAARNLAEASLLLEGLAAADAKFALRGNRLAVGKLQRLGAARAKNLLRWMLTRQGEPAPESDRLHEALRQIFEAGDDASVRIVLGAYELRRFAGDAYLLPALSDPPAALKREWDGKRDWHLPELGGTLRLARRRGAGLSAARVIERGLTVRLRQGGEKLRVQAHGPTRSLKNLLQESRMPPWERERLPLVYCADTLVAVPGLGVASGWQAREDETGWVLNWRRKN